MPGKVSKICINAVEDHLFINGFFPPLFKCKTRKVTWCKIPKLLLLKTIGDALSKMIDGFKLIKGILVMTGNCPGSRNFLLVRYILDLFFNSF